ncbi:MAG: 30S ribosomal protein S7 [Candidatus Omnitrophica bacterium CG11_big_fil_rev_8_21_14_0_20_63_9]|nr:MAG: 30S ribosomal protein S7 [Candidatus Omnitrophica bacterium CG11_big_fil_rev_8_21_14_0_20_63_9]
MSRRRRRLRQETQPDSRYNNRLVQKMINMLMSDGKKSKAEGVVYDAFETLKKSVGTNDVLTVFHKAIENVRPHVELKARRVGGATYQIPIEVRHERGMSLAIRWIRVAARGKRGAPMAKRLADELLSAYKGEGTAVRKREETHKMAEANRAFAHYRW